MEDLLAALGNAKDTAAKPRIHVELKMLGTNMSERTVSGILRSVVPSATKERGALSAFFQDRGAKLFADAF